MSTVNFCGSIKKYAQTTPSENGLYSFTEMMKKYDDLTAYMKTK
jgi:hypothetical protein